MTNTNLLKSKMVLVGDDDCVAALSKLLEVSRPTASDKLNGIRPFNQLEIKEIARHYNLSADDIVNIFIVVGGDDQNVDTISPSE